MAELKVYRWASALVPGSIAAGVAVTALPRGSALIEATAKRDPTFIAVGGIALLAAYVLGVLMWGVGYFVRCVHLMPFTSSDRRNRFLRPDVAGTRWGYSELRCWAARKELGEDLSPVEFRRVIALSLESLEKWGGRLEAQWEFIGMLQAASMSCIVALVVALSSSLSPDSSLLSTNPYLPPSIYFAAAALYLGLGITYKYRVITLGRDVATAVVLLRRRGDLPSNPSWTVALDFDGVIADTDASKRKWLADEGIETPVGPLDRTRCVALLGEDVYDRMSATVHSPSWTMSTPPLPGALEAIDNLLQRNARLVVVTVRKGAAFKAARRWLNANVGKGRFRIERTGSMTKIDIATEFGGVALVDDDIRHLGSGTHCPIRRFRMSWGLALAPAPTDVVSQVADWRTLEQLLLAQRPEGQARSKGLGEEVGGQGLRHRGF